MRTRIAATALAVALGGAGTGGLILTQAANAQSTTTTTAPPAAGATAPTDAARTQRRTDELTAALKGLTDAGTITAAQRDAVVQALLEAKVAGGGGGHRGGHGRGVLGAGLDAAAKALGTDAAGLRTALAGGQSIAAVAAEKGVSVDTVVAAVVAAETARLDQAVTDGTLTQARADAAKATLTQRVTDAVNSTRPAFKGAGGKGGHRGGHSPATTAAGATSA